MWRSKRGVCRRPGPGKPYAVVEEGGMSGIVVIVIAALLGWCLVSGALALLVGRRLRRAAPPVVHTWIRPVRIADEQRRDRRPAA